MGNRGRHQTSRLTTQVTSNLNHRVTAVRRSIAAANPLIRFCRVDAEDVEKSLLHSRPVRDCASSPRLPGDDAVRRPAAKRQPLVRWLPLPLNRLRAAILAEGDSRALIVP